VELADVRAADTVNRPVFRLPAVRRFRAVNQAVEFAVRKRSARTGRNPQTGATIKIKASKVPAFKAGKALKDAVN